MENTKRARKEKSRIRPSGETYVEPKHLLSGLERVREAARRDVAGEWSRTVIGMQHYVPDLCVHQLHPYPNQRLCVTEFCNGGRW